MAKVHAVVTQEILESSRAWFQWLVPGISGVTNKLECAADLRFGATFKLSLQTTFTALHFKLAWRFTILHEIYSIGSSRDNFNLPHWPESVGLHDANQNYS